MFIPMTDSVMTTAAISRSTIWKRRLAWGVVALLVFTIGMAIVSPAKAATTMVHAMSAMKSIGIEQPSQLGMLLVGIVGVIVGRQSGIFLSKKRQSS